MSAKDSTSSKKEKSFNGTKAKYSPNVVVPEKKAEVKLRRKDSEKVKQSSDSNRKSVFGRLFHFADSDDSRKKTAAADAKKKKTHDHAGPGGDLDLPEHGIVVRQTQAVQSDMQMTVNPRIKAMTLTNPPRDSRNRWSSYDLHGYNFVDGMSQRQPEIKLDCSTLGHRSQSEETLFPESKQSNIAESFDAANHSNSVKQPDVMRKHARLLQSIQHANASKGSRTERTGEIQEGQGLNEWLIVTKQMALPEGHVHDTPSKETQIADQQSVDGKETSSSSKLAVVNGNNKSQQCVANSSSNAFALLDEKGKMINRALDEKHKILSQLFGVSETDMEGLTEKDVESSDSSIQQAVMLSVLQSDHLTSVINNIMIPYINFSKLKNAAASQEENKASFDDQISGHTKALQSSAFRLHSHLETLQKLIEQEADETNRLKKELENTQERIKLVELEKNSMLAEQNSTEAKQPQDSIPEISVNVSTVVDEKSHLATSNDVHKSSLEKSRETQDHETENVCVVHTQLTLNKSVDLTEENEEEGSLNDTSVNNTGLKQMQPPSAPKCVIPNKELPDDNTSPVLLSPVVENIEVEVQGSVQNQVIVPDKPDLYHQELCASLPYGHEFDLPVTESVNSIKKTVDEELNSVAKDESDLVEEFQTDSDKDVVALYHADDGRRFRNLESIPEDDDRVSFCDSDSKIFENENLEHDDAVEENLKVSVEGDTQLNVVKFEKREYHDGDISYSLSDMEAKSHNQTEIFTGPDFSPPDVDILHNVKGPEVESSLELLAEEHSVFSMEDTPQTKEERHIDSEVENNLENNFVEKSLALEMKDTLDSEVGKDLVTRTEYDLLNRKLEQLESHPENALSPSMASEKLVQEVAKPDNYKKLHVISDSNSISDLENYVDIEFRNIATDAVEIHKDPVAKPSSAWTNPEDISNLDDNESDISEGFVTKLMMISLSE